MTLQKLNELAKQTAFYKDITNPVRLELNSPTNTPLKVQNGVCSLGNIETSSVTASKIFDEYILRYEFKEADFPENLDARQLEIFIGSLLNKSKLEYTNATIKCSGSENAFRDSGVNGKVELRLFVLASEHEETN